MSMDWLDLMRGLTEAHIENLGISGKATGNAPETDSPMAGSGGEVSIPVLSSPLQQFAGERDGTLDSHPAAALTSPAKHSGDTITRLMDAVAVCEERSRR